MSYEFYKVTHIVSVVILFVAMTGFLYSRQKVFSIFHGVGLLAILVSGFGLLARMGLINGFPTWIWIKLGVWFTIGALYAVTKRKLLPANLQILLWLTLGGLAVYSAVVKPLF